VCTGPRGRSAGFVIAAMSTLMDTAGPVPIVRTS
jgi:hypothetical protein